MDSVKYINKFLIKIENIFKTFDKDLRNFSLKIALSKAFEELFGMIRLRKFSSFCANIKHKYILNYLTKNYKYIFDKYNGFQVVNNQDYNPEAAPIWVCWLDGVENSPKLVQQCVKSIKKNSGNHPVILITLKNFNKYIELPSYIIEKFNKKIITPAQFSDILRVSLLANHGGLWLDSTIYCSKTILDDYFKQNIFTCKSGELDNRYVSKKRWTSFCLGGKPNHPLYMSLQDFFFEYWKKENYLIEYLLIDYSIEIARVLIPEVDKQLKLICPNNLLRDELISRFANPWFVNCCDDLFNSDTVLFKLGYREKFYLNEYTVDGKKTVYNAFLKNFYLENKGENL